MHWLMKCNVVIYEFSYILLDAASRLTTDISTIKTKLINHEIKNSCQPHILANPPPPSCLSVYANIR